MPFLNNLDAILVDPEQDLWELDSPLIYIANDKMRYHVPRGFRCDFASVPRLPVTWMIFKGSDTHRPGVLHDYLCDTVPRHTADNLFYEALRSEGVGVVRARLMWVAVRLWGMV